MTTINTASEARAYIFAAIETVGRDAVLEEVVQFSNTIDNDIDENGDVWVANPQTGHWLNDNDLIAFGRFLA